MYGFEITHLAQFMTHNPLFGAYVFQNESDVFIISQCIEHEQNVDSQTT